MRSRCGTSTDSAGRVWPANRLATDGPMLGRARQLADAERTLEPRADGVRRVVIRGSAGIGKSRLGRALADRATARGWRVTAGGFVGFGDATPYGAWQPVLRSILGGGADVAGELERLIPESGEFAPLLGPVLGLSMSGPGRSASVDGELQSELAEDFAARVIEAAALERPVMIELEDWHSADAASARLLDVVTRRPSAAPVTLVVTERPVEGVPLEPRETDTVIDLTELDDVVARDVADSVLARLGQQADAGRLDWIVELGAGNPLMIETLIDVGGEIAVTTGLAPLLQARLDGLADAGFERALLWASAFGRPVVTDELDAAMRTGDQGDADIALRLSGLVAHGLLAPVATDAGVLEAPLAFRHASVREAAYERLSHEARRYVHHAVALTLEARAGRAVEIAHHLARTDDIERQRDWFPKRDGKRAMRGRCKTPSDGSIKLGGWETTPTRCDSASPTCSWSPGGIEPSRRWCIIHAPFRGTTGGGA